MLFLQVRRAVNTFVLRQLLFGFMERYPFLRKPVRRLWNTYDRIKFRYFVSRNLRRQGKEPAPIDPFWLFTVDAEDVEYYVYDFNFITDAGLVVDGDWDTESNPDMCKFESIEHHRSFVEHFENDVPWEDTELYQTYVEQVENGQHSRCKSMERLEEWIRQYDELYKSIARDGYKTQYELLKNGRDPMVRSGVGGLLPASRETAVVHEITVNVGRNGHLYLNDGRHRLSMAKIQGIEVPVRVVVRHRGWQDLRNQVARAVKEHDDGVSTQKIRRNVEEALKEELEDVFMGLDHPDLQVLFDTDE